jgi:hypothetical protein
MNSNQPVPLSLKIVAGLFIFEGVCAAIWTLLSLMHGRVYLPGDLGILGLFIGPGLLRFSRGWRTCALVFLWITLVATSIVALLLLISRKPINVGALGWLAVRGFVPALWQSWVLTRPNVRALFDHEEDQPSTSPDDPGSRP